MSKISILQLLMMWYKSTTSSHPCNSRIKIWLWKWLCF